MNIRINIDETFCFPGEKSIQINTEKFRDYSVFPNHQGVYIFHVGSVDKIWERGDNILYIGAANRELLRKKIKKNAKAKILKPSNETNNYTSPIYVSYCSFEDRVPDYIPFLVEGFLLYQYETKFGKLPFANKGRR